MLTMRMKRFVRRERRWRWEGPIPLRRRSNSRRRHGWPMGAIGPEHGQLHLPKIIAGETMLV